MPDFWEFPTVSMGLGPIMAIYQARFHRYLEDRGLKPRAEPQGLGLPRRRRDRRARGAGRHHAGLAREARQPDLRHQLQPAAARRPGARQRPDHPGTGGRLPRRRLERHQGASGAPSGMRCSSATPTGCWSKRMGEIVDGEYQKYAVEPGAYIRKHFFGADPRLLEMVQHLSDEQLKQAEARRPRSGEGLRRLSSAAVEHKGAPTVILARTIKGYGLGEAGEGKNITHQQKKLNEDELREFRTRFGIPISDDEVAEAPFYRPAEDSPEIEVPARAPRGAGRLRAARGATTEAHHAGPRAESFDEFYKGTGDREVSTTMAFVRMLAKLLRDKQIGKLHRADRARRGAHVRHGGALPPGRHLLPRRPALRAGRHATPCCTTRKRRTGRSSRRASPRPARCRRSSPPAPPMPPTASTRSRSSSTTRCSASSASAT